MERILYSLLLVLGMAMPASSEMMDMPMMEYREQHRQMMGMCSVDRMNEMIELCLRYADKVGLSDEQLEKMKPLRMEMQKKQARFSADVKIAEIDLMEIMEVKDFDIGKATAAVERIAEIKKAHHLEMLTAMKGMRAVLTEEQFNTMKKMMMTMPDQRGEPATKGTIKKHQ